MNRFRLAAWVALAILVQAAWILLAHGDRTSAAAGPPPLDSPSLRSAMALLPQMHRSETDHYVILSDASEADVALVGRLLEDVAQQFTQTASELDWQPAPLRHKLVAVLFSNERDFRGFAARYDQLGEPWATGYYNPTEDRLVLFSLESGDELRKAMQQLDDQEYQAAMNRQRGQVNGDALSVNQGPSRSRHAMDAERSRLRDAALSGFVCTAAHEAAHQLLIHTDIQRRGAVFPQWLAEGLAANFETERLGVRFGYKHDNWRRRDALQHAATADTLLPLDRLVTRECAVCGVASAEGVDGVYAQSYALVNWLMRERPTELRLYLDALRDGSFSVATARRDGFIAAFGPIELNERNWVRSEGRRSKSFLASAYGRRVLDAPVWLSAHSTQPAVPDRGRIGVGQSQDGQEDNSGEPAVTRNSDGREP
jgi:hypothetical protein